MLEGTELREIAYRRNFNLWRKKYEDLSFEIQKIIYDAWTEYYYNKGNIQRCGNLISWGRAFEFLTMIGEINLKDVSVLELGSYDGWLAYNSMNSIKFKKWTGYDICGWIVNRTIQGLKEKNFENIELQDYIYDTKVDNFDIFVSSHTLEHITKKECFKTLDWAMKKANILMIELGTTEEGREWNDFDGSHILEVGRKEVAAFVRQHKYNQMIFGEVDVFLRRD